MKSIIGKLRQEVQRVEADLQLRVEKLNQLKAAYDALANGQHRHVAQQLHRRPRPGTVRSEIISLLKNGPKHRKELLDHLARKHILRGTENDMNYIASRLSMWPETKTDGKGNWHLES